MKISVVIPMFNASRTISTCLEALFHQEVLPFEVIVVDNNSTDDSREIVQNSRQSLKPLNIILCEETKKGPSAARNKGASLACGEIIAFTDSDCVPDQCWIKGIETAFSRDKGLDVIGGVFKAPAPAATLIGKFLSAFWLPPDFFTSRTVVQKKEEIFDGQYLNVERETFKAQ